MKTLDILKKHNFTDNVQKNIKLLLKNYGNKFNIKYNKHILTVKLYKNLNIKCYELCYDIDNRTYDLAPFKITFHDPTIVPKQLNNNSYISNIHKTEQITGTEMVEIALTINKMLNVKKTYIHDGTNIKCGTLEYDLSYMKLLEKNTTFYMKFGFKFRIGSHDFIRFNTNDEKHIFIVNVISKCRKIEIKSVLNMYLRISDLLHLIIKQQDYSKLKIQLIEPYDKTNIWYKDKSHDSLIELFTETKLMIELLKNANFKYLYKFMLFLFNDKEKCIKLDSIYKYIIGNRTYKIIYKNITISYDFLFCFKILKALRYTMFEYTF